MNGKMFSLGQLNDIVHFALFCDCENKKTQIDKYLRDN